MYFVKEALDNEAKTCKDIVAFLARDFAEKREGECKMACSG